MIILRGLHAGSDDMYKGNAIPHLSSTTELYTTGWLKSFPRITVSQLPSQSKYSLMEIPDLPYFINQESERGVKYTKVIGPELWCLTLCLNNTYMWRGLIKFLSSRLDYTALHYFGKDPYWVLPQLKARMEQMLMLPSEELLLDCPELAPWTCLASGFK